jgi:Domain of unknown function (DUF4168)
MFVIRIVAIAAVLACIVTVPALAQQSGGNLPSQTPGGTPQGGEVSDAMVHKVGTAMRHVGAIRQSYEQRAKSANTQQQMKDLQDQAQKEMVSAISHEGLSVQQYQNTIQMAQADSTLRQRLISAAQQSGE